MALNVPLLGTSVPVGHIGRLCRHFSKRGGQARFNLTPKKALVDDLCSALAGGLAERAPVLSGHLFREIADWAATYFNSHCARIVPVVFVGY